MAPCRRNGADADIGSNILQSVKKSGVQNAVTDPGFSESAELGVSGLAEDSTDIFLSQISMRHVLLLQERFRKLHGVNVGAHELFTPCELLEGLRCPAVIMRQRWSGQTKAVGGASRWTAGELDGQTDDYHFSPFASQRKEIGGF